MRHYDHPFLISLEELQERGEKFNRENPSHFEEESAKVKSIPTSLEYSLDALERDHDFLLRGDVFTKDVIETWINYKRTKEIDAIRLRPHPHEFALYFDI